MPGLLGLSTYSPRRDDRSLWQSHFTFTPRSSRMPTLNDWLIASRELSVCSATSHSINLLERIWLHMSVPEPCLLLDGRPTRYNSTASLPSLLVRPMDRILGRKRDPTSYVRPGVQIGGAFRSLKPSISACMPRWPRLMPNFRTVARSLDIPTAVQVVESYVHTHCAALQQLAKSGAHAHSRCAAQAQLLYPPTFPVRMRSATLRVQSDGQQRPKRRAVPQPMLVVTKFLCGTPGPA